jgi:response regulator RpfG family c-di-GMP phosphodiesterase
MSSSHAITWLYSLLHVTESYSDLEIVLVEDHDDARRYLNLFLGQLGAKVIVAKDAFEGLEAIKNSGPDLVLPDIKMPGMNGFRIAESDSCIGKNVDQCGLRRKIKAALTTTCSASRAT